jgi:two-component system chemotaxis sensor kinase CheA
MPINERTHREFIAEASEIVEHLQAGLVRISEERRRGRHAPAILNEVFRHAHSLKGLAGMFGLEAMSRLAHQMETLLDGLRLGRLELDDELMATLYACADAFGGQLADAHAGHDTDPRLVEALLEKIAERTSPRAPTTPSPRTSLLLSPETLTALTEYEEHRLQDNLGRGTPLWRAHAPLPLDSFEQQLAALTTAAHAIGELITSLPSTDQSGQGLLFDLLLASSASLDELTSTLAPLGVTVLERIDQAAPQRPPESHVALTAPAMHASSLPSAVERAPTPAPLPSPATTTKTAGTLTTLPTSPDESARDGLGSPSIRQLADTVRVDIKKLDELMGIVGELVLARGGLSRVTNELKASIGFRGVAIDLHRLVRAMERRIVDLQTAIMQVRMVPLGQVFERLSLVARRTADSVGKDVELVVTGEDTELDKLIVEDLVDPLMHMVRNAVDHGLESADVRRRAGKPEAGRLELRAFPRGNHVVIEIADDGRGIDDVAIRRTALDRGLVDEDHVGQMSRREVWNLMFLPGFSTRREVTSLSGRGVGLDVVKTNVQRLSGLIDVDSTPGRGTRFVITLPMTLAIIQAVIVKCAGRVYALPLASVLEMVAVGPADVCTVEGREMITLREQTLPLLRLDRLFHPGDARSGPIAEGAYAAVVGLVQHRAALLVDDVIGQQDIVIKSLGAYLQGVRGIAGATHLGDHETILVLDVGALMEELMSGETGIGSTSTNAPSAPASTTGSRASSRGTGG